MCLPWVFLMKLKCCSLPSAKPWDPGPVQSLAFSRPGPFSSPLARCYMALQAGNRAASSTKLIPTCRHEQKEALLSRSHLSPHVNRNLSAPLISDLPPHKRRPIKMS